VFFGHCNIQHTARYIELSPTRFKDFWSGLWWGFCSRAAPLLRCGFEADSLDGCVKVIDDAVIEAVELRPLLIRDSGVGADGAEETAVSGA
jgi:hypothetical protein